MGEKSTRATKQRAAIEQALEGEDAFLSAQELYDVMRRRGVSIGLATVYRNLQAMAQRGDIDVLRRDDGEIIYRRCETETHHHHLVCRNCGYTVELEEDQFERWAGLAAKRFKFSDVTHDIEFAGLCADCSGRGPRVRPRPQNRARTN